MENILGEESNKFTNSSGQVVSVSVLPTQVETVNHLETVLGGNRKLAARLAKVIHVSTEGNVGIDNDVETESSAPFSFSHQEDLLPFANRLSTPIPLQNLGIWVDPIDSTAEYIKGLDGANFQNHGILVKGLQSAVILIGIFDRVTGEPVLGVIYQPFGEKTKKDCAENGVNANGNDTEKGAKKEKSDADPDKTPQSGADLDELLFSDAVSSQPKAEVDGADVAAGASAAHSCWQERYTWGVCYGDIKLYSSGGAPPPSNHSASYSPHSSFSFHSFPGWGAGGRGGVGGDLGGNGSKGSQDFSSASSLLPSVSQPNNTNSNELRSHSHHSTPLCNDTEQKVITCR